MQGNGWIAAGDETAVTNGVLVLVVAAIDRANTAVGLHDNSIVTGLFERRKNIRSRRTPSPEISAVLISCSSLPVPKLRRSITRSFGVIS
jgi:hypothetical protein